MTNVETSTKKEQANGSVTDTQKTIENHKKAAKHHEEAAKHHHEAAKHREAGNHEKANTSTLKAHGHHAIAGSAQRSNLKQHALSN